MNARIAPGVTNLLTAELLWENPDAYDVELVFTVTTSDSSELPVMSARAEGRGTHERPRRMAGARVPAKSWTDHTP